jgi:transposase-like protein
MITLTNMGKYGITIDPTDNVQPRLKSSVQRRATSAIRYSGRAATAGQPRHLRRVFDAGEPAEAERRLKDIVAHYQKSAPQLAAWLEHAAPEAIPVLMIPTTHRRRLRKTNGLERLNKEIKRRTRVAPLFPNEASLLRLASAVLSEISDNWQTEHAYLNMEAK